MEQVLESSARNESWNRSQDKSQNKLQKSEVHTLQSLECVAHASLKPIQRFIASGLFVPSSCDDYVKTTKHL